MKKSLLVVAATVPLLAGCGTDSVPESEVEEITKDRLVSDFGDGVAVEKVDCPEGLEAEKGATMSCTGTVNGEDIEIKLTVTKVDDETAEFEYELP